MASGLATGLLRFCVLEWPLVEQEASAGGVDQDRVLRRGGTVGGRLD